MPEYRRAFQPGGTFFFTLVTNFRRKILTTLLARVALREALDRVRIRRPFEIEAIVLLPDHLHCIWTLPENDADFSTRWRLIKTRFTRLFLQRRGSESGRSESRRRHGEQGVWQRRYWEHTVRDEREYERLCDYIHYNPVKHGYVACPHAWAYSSFQRFVDAHRYNADWLCLCGRASVELPDFATVEEVTGE